MQTLKLDQLRNILIRQEETIIFALIERAQFKQNPPVYLKGGILPDYSGAFCDYLLWETEKVHAKVRRYTSPDEHPFCLDLPEPILEKLSFPPIIQPTTINVNAQIRKIYEDDMLPLICQTGDDGNYGSSAVCDVACLQALSKRIHYGKYVAEAKYQAETERYRTMIAARDSEGIEAALTNTVVEEKLLRRVEVKTATYGQEIDAEETRRNFKIQPEVVSRIYRNWIIPLTKVVEVDYLLERKDNA